jgi:hypothetical protein
MIILSAPLELQHASSKMYGQTDRFILLAGMQESKCTLKLTIINARREAEGSFPKVAMLSCSVTSGDSSVSKQAGYGWTKSVQLPFGTATMYEKLRFSRR